MFNSAWGHGRSDQEQCPLLKSPAIVKEVAIAGVRIKQKQLTWVSSVGCYSLWRLLTVIVA